VGGRFCVRFFMEVDGVGVCVFLNVNVIEHHEAHSI
jgi:hypothetical protein